MSDDENPVLVDRQGAVTWLTLNRPDARNSLSLSLMAAMQKALEQIASDPTVRVVVIAARGKVFCAGHDLKEVHGLESESHLALFEACSRLMLTLRRIPQPVIASVHGMATAAGCQLVASCDLAVAAQSARFATPGVNIGLFCSTPMVALSRNIPAKQAMAMLLTGDPVDADDALRHGLINQVVADEALDEAVRALAKKLSLKPAPTLALGKAAFYRQMEMSEAQAYEFTARVMADNMKIADAREGIGAFLDKRTPAWEQDRD